MDLFELASQNSDALRTEYQDLTDQLEARGFLTKLEDFVARVKSDARLSFNMRQHAITGMMSSEKHNNMYELASDEHAETPGKSREQILEERLKGYYSARMTFDQAFDDAERFRYSALNIGGLGSTDFGGYCVVLKRRFWNTCAHLAFIKQDSLIGYVGDSGIDMDRLKREVGDKQHVHILAASKHQDKLQTRPSEEWDAMVCSFHAYIEAVTKESIPVSAVDSVRMAKQEYDTHYNELFEAYAGQMGTAPRRVRNFAELLTLFSRHQIKLEIIDD